MTRRLDDDRPGEDGRTLAVLGRDRAALLGLGVAVVASVALCLYLTRGTTLGADEYLYFVVNRGFDIKGLLSPHNGNLIAVPRLIYATVFALFGPDYVVLRILEVAGVAAAGVLFFVVVRRRCAGVAALALTAPLLFLGSAPDVALYPLGITVVYAVVFGLGALRALEAQSRRGDVLACALLSLSVATFSVSVAFLAWAAVYVLLSDRRWQRLYVVVVPVAVYLAWKFGAPKYSGPGYLAASVDFTLSNLRLVPGFVVKSAAAATAAVSGLNYPFGTPIGGLGELEHYGIGFVLAGALAVALALRAARGRVGRSIWPFLAMALAYWTAIALVSSFNRFPNSTRYLYAGAIAVLLIAAEGWRRSRLKRWPVVALLAASGVALGFNIAELHQDGIGVRRASMALRATETGMQLAAGHLRSNELPGHALPMFTLVDLGGGVRPYLRAVRRNGSPAFTLAELRRAPDVDRGVADATLAAALRISLVPTAVPHRGCRRMAGGGGRPVTLALHAPGTIVVSARRGPVRLARFADRPFVPIGALVARRAFALALAPDGAPDPWRVRLPAGPFRLCPL